MVACMVNVDAYVERADPEVLGDNSTALDVEEVVGICHQRADHLRARSGRNNGVRIGIRSRGAGSNLIGIMEDHVRHSGTRSLQGYERPARGRHEKRGSDCGQCWIYSRRVVERTSITPHRTTPLGTVNVPVVK